MPRICQVQVESCPYKKSLYCARRVQRFLRMQYWRWLPVETTSWAGEGVAWGGWPLREQHPDNKLENQRFVFFSADLHCFETWSSTTFLVLRGGWVCLREHLSINHSVKEGPHPGSFSSSQATPKVYWGRRCGFWWKAPSSSLSNRPNWKNNALILGQNPESPKIIGAHPDGSPSWNNLGGMRQVTKVSPKLSLTTKCRALEGE